MKSVADSLIFRRRDWVGVLCLGPLAGVVLLSPPWASKDRWLSLAFHGTGWLFLAAYLAFRIWATLFAGGRKDRILQTQGPYSITRNPLYVGSFCLALSSCAFLQSPALLAGVCLLYVLYARGVVAAEEKMLLQLFPQEYPPYLQRTPRFLPNFSLYESPSRVEVNLAALQREARRLAGAALIPVGAEVLSYLRAAPWWPHLFSFY